MSPLYLELFFGISVWSSDKGDDWQNINKQQILISCSANYLEDTLRNVKKTQQPFGSAPLVLRGWMGGTD